MSDAWKNFEPIFISILADTVQLMDREGVPQTAVAHFVMGSRTSIERKKEPIPVPRERTRNQTRAKNISQSSQKSTDSFIINDSPETSKTKTVQNSKKSVLELLDEEEAIEITSLESILDTPLRELYSDILHLVADPEGEESYRVRLQFIFL